jgi:hypothetical protein
MALNPSITGEQMRAEKQLRRRQVGGLLIIMTMIVVGSIFHAGISQVFPLGWWRIW